jgi:ketosteroid isomerase-like protein
MKDKARETAQKAKRRIGVERPLAAEEGGRVGIVRGALQAFGSGDMDGFLDALADNAAFECPSGKNFPGAGDHEGADEVRKTFIADAGRTYASFGFEPELFVEAEDDDAVIAFGRFAGEGVEGGALDTRAVQVWEFKGNTVEAVRIYADSADFPAVVTEQQLKEQEQEQEQEEKEKEQEHEQEEPKSSGEDQDSKDSDEDKDDS